MIKRKAAHYLAVALTIGLFALSVVSQTTTQYDRTTPPQHASGVSSAGSYISAELGTVNLTNGSLNFKIPIGSVGGRGFSIPLTLNYSSKVWSASMDTDVNWAGEEKPVAYADYDRGGDWAGWGNFIAAGWSVGGVPIFNTRRVQIQRITGGPCNGGYAYLLAKLTLKMPDGGEVEFRDDLYDGAPLPASGCGSSAASRGVRWHATDGSGMIFINDVDNGVANFDTSGVVITRDGARYRFDGSWCTSITDRNGNRITIQYLTPLEVRYTDQLGRVTIIKQNVPDPDNPSIMLAVLVTFPGYQGQSRHFKIKAGVMNQNYRSDIAPTLPVITGDWDPLSKGYAWPAGTTRLFNKSYGMYAYQIDDLTVLTEVVLPDSRSLRFRYNKFGEVAEVTLPTGGKIQYDYSYNPALPSGNSPVWQTGTGGAGGGILTDVKTIDRAVVESRTYPDGSTLEGKWNYIYSPQSVNGATHPCTQVQAWSNTDTLQMDQRHFFLTASQYTETPVSGNHDGTHYAIWSTGVEWRTETRNGAGSVLTATEQDWTQRASVSWSTYAQEQPAKDNRVNQSRRYLENGMMAKTETTYDQYNNPTEVREYDFDQTLKRRTATTYLTWNNGFNYATDDAIHMLSLPDTTTIFNSAGTAIAQSVNEYDVYTSDGNHASLTDYGLVSQHDSNCGVAKTTRGNVTRVGQWLNTNGTFIYSYPRFDTLGNVVSTKDANGNVTTFSFADDFGPGQSPGSPSQNPSTPTYALLTLITSPPPLPGAPVHTARSQYDYSTGLPTGFRDRNNVVTQTIYDDPLNRPTQIKSALGVSGVESHATSYYAPATVFGITLAKNDVLTVTDLNTLDDASIRSWTITDGFGRTVEAWNRDPQGDVKVITIYDALGRAKQTSNPFRPASESAVYTTTAYDLAGRVTSVTTPDNAVVSTSYLGNTVTVTDQAGKARKSVTDALGRLIEAYEDPSGPGNPSGLNYQTTYAYDVLDNLVKVTQGSQQRFFMYDSLKRLLRARNPEQGTHGGLDLTDPLTQNSQWSIGYAYDASGNLTQKTDARGVVSSYEYDALNRNIRINYSDTPSINPDVKRFYDGPANGKGRFWYFYSGGDYSTGSDVDHTSIDSYDALGRPLVQRQLFKLNGTWSTAYQTARAYNRAGGVTSQTYPSGHSVTYNYDSAGRLADQDAQNPAFTGNLGDGVQRTYSRGISYASFGQLKQEQFGTSSAVYHKLHYNIRRQLCDVRASNVNDEWGGELGGLVNYYSASWAHCGSGSDNNGNVLMSQTIINSVYFEDRYRYDALNRLTAIREYQNGSTLTGIQEYDYDRWGNRSIKPASTLGLNKEFTVFPATNRLGVPAGQAGVMTYDNAGNLTTDTYTSFGDRVYDADNRMTSAQANGGWFHYTYNADGQRVRRKINNQETWQLYGFDGELLAEYAANGPVATPQKEYGYRNGQLLVTATSSSDNSLNLNGTSAYVQVPNSSSLNISGAITVEAWIKLNSIGVYQDIVTRESYGQAGTGGGYGLTVTNLGKPRIDIYHGPTQYTHVIGNTTMSTGVWYHVAGVWDGSYLNIYLNGVLDGSISTGNGPASGTSSLKIGRNSGGGYFSGLIDELRVSNTAVYTSNFTPQAHLTASSSTNGLWKFDGQSTADSSGNNNNGTLQGGATYSNAVPDGGGGTSSSGVQWLIVDHLGTPRMIIDQTGTLANIKRHDYLPFGEELFAPVGGRSPALGYASGDGVRQQFTAKERDVETGLDFFGARYYASMQGRFTSSDEFLNSGRLENPQTWNRYAYVLNNPLAFTDPFGLYEYAEGTSDKNKKRFEEQLKNGGAQLDKIKARYGADSSEYNNAKRALDAYGGVGEENGVIVTFGKTSEGTPGATSGFFKTDGTKGINVTIDLSKNKADSLLLGTIAHEGSHVQDHADLVDGILKTPLNADAVAARLNITVGASETMAYTVQSVFAEFTYKNEQPSESRGGVIIMRMEVTQESAVIGATGTKIWNPSWAASDVAKIRSQRSAAIVEGLNKSSLYKDKLTKPILR